MASHADVAGNLPLLQAVPHPQPVAEHPDVNAIEAVLDNIDDAWIAEFAATAPVAPSTPGGTPRSAGQCRVHSSMPFLIERPNECQSGEPASKKRRCQWTPELHAVFEDAVRKAGPRPTPTTVHAAMDVPSLNLGFDLTVGMVKSHLQKYKLDCMCSGKQQLIPSQHKAEKRADSGDDAASEEPSVQAKAPAAAAGAGASRAAGDGVPPIAVTVLEAPGAMALLVRTFTGYGLHWEYEQSTNSLALQARPPAMHLGTSPCRLGVTSLPGLEDARPMDGLADELAASHARTFPLPRTPKVADASAWPVEVVSTGNGDRTVCITVHVAQEGGPEPEPPRVVC